MRELTNGGSPMRSSGVGGQVKRDYAETSAQSTNLGDNPDSE